MFDVGTPIPGQIGRQVCIYFRAAEPGDSEILKIQYGNGCSASVSFEKLKCFENVTFYLGWIQCILSKNS